MNSMIILIFSLIIIAGVFYFFKIKTQWYEKLNESEKEKELWKSKFELLEQTYASQEKKSELLTEKMNQNFEIMAQKIFEEKSSKFADQNQKNISTILEPLKEKIKDFEKKVEDTYSSERSERGILRGEINKLMELNQVMSHEASNLTKALKGEVKTQGNWGELILENILDKSGLRKGEEYTTQGSDMGLKNDQGQTIKPDVIIHLPDNKHLIVDSKMTLTAYESYSSSENTEDQERFGKLHIESLKKHIDGLSEKKYHLADKLITPDFVMLFMPLEPAFSLAFKLKPELFQYAWERNIVIVSPTTLLTSLRTVSTIWKQERQQRNALDIAKRGGALYDKFVGILKDIEAIGDKLESTLKSHTELVSKMSTGRGNLLRQVEDLKELGAKTDKNFPNYFLEAGSLEGTDSDKA